MKIIFAQGNPEPDYNNTRHNTGFLILNELVNESGAKWDEKTKFNAFISEINIAGEKTLLVKPTSYYNDTGLVIQKIINFYKLQPQLDLLVIHDDLTLPFGTIRVRKKGSDAGNNGIKSINASIGQDYTRIRIGIENELRSKMNDDAAFVLSKFSKDELQKLKSLIFPKVSELIKDFCNQTLDITSHKINSDQKSEL